MDFLSKLKEVSQKWTEKGINLPFAFDPVEKGPSITLWFLHITFVLAVYGAIALFRKEVDLISACFSLFFWVLAMVFYRMRKLDKFKIDLDDKSIEIDAEDEKKD